MVRPLSVLPCGSRSQHTSFFKGLPCDSDGNYLANPDTPPPPRTTAVPDDWSPFTDRLQFEMADWLSKKTQLPHPDIDFLMDAFAAFGGEGHEPSFVNHDHLHKTLDAIEHGDAPWECIVARYQGPISEENAPWWMTQEYEIWCQNTRTTAHNMLRNPDFKESFYTGPYCKFNEKEERVFSHLMLANFAWRQVVSLLVSNRVDRY